MSLNVNKVWLKRNEQEILVKSSDIEPGDHVVIRMGNVIPFDGEVVTGEGMVNQRFARRNGRPAAVFPLPEKVFRKAGAGTAKAYRRTRAWDTPKGEPMRRR